MTGKKKNGYRWMKRALSLLLSLLLAASPVLRQPVYAAGSGTAEDISDDIDAFCAELWETVQEEGEDVIGFPGRVADRLDPDDGGAYYGFYLEETTDISILLSSEYPCYLLLCRNEKPVNIRTLPYNTQKIEETGLPAGYYLLYVIPQPESEGKTNEFSLNLESLMDLDEEPDYSELDLSGKIHNLVSPYWRRPGSDDPDMRQTKNVSGSSLKAGGYLTSWLGPIDEEVMPSGRDQVYADKPTRYMQYAPVLPSVHVQDMSILPRTKADGSDRGWGEYVAHWKNAIMTRGALEVGMFMNKQALFALAGIYYAPQFRPMEDHFGIIPLPKYDDAQDGYRSPMFCNVFPLTAIPSTVADKENAGIITEAMSYEGSSPVFSKISVSQVPVNVMVPSSATVNVSYTREPFDT